MLLPLLVAVPEVLTRSKPYIFNTLRVFKSVAESYFKKLGLDVRRDLLLELRFRRSGETKAPIIAYYNTRKIRQSPVILIQNWLTSSKIPVGAYQSFSFLSSKIREAQEKGLQILGAVVRLMKCDRGKHCNELSVENFKDPIQALRRYFELKTQFNSEELHPSILFEIVHAGEQRYFTLPMIVVYANNRFTGVRITRRFTSSGNPTYYIPKWFRYMSLSLNNNALNRLWTSPVLRGSSPLPNSYIDSYLRPSAKLNLLHESAMFRLALRSAYAMTKVPDFLELERNFVKVTPDRRIDLTLNPELAYQPPLRVPQRASGVSYPSSRYQPSRRQVSPNPTVTYLRRLIRELFETP